MRGRARQHLFLRQQPGSDFDFAADAERVDPLVAGRRLRARPHHRPVITLRAAPESARPAARSTTPTRSSWPSPLRSTTLKTSTFAQGLGARGLKGVAARSSRRPARSAIVPRPTRPDRARRCCRGRRETADSVPTAAGSIGSGHVAERLLLPRRAASARTGECARAESSVTRSRTPSPLTSPIVSATVVPRPAGAVISRNSPPCRFSNT